MFEGGREGKLELEGVRQTSEGGWWNTKSTLVSGTFMFFAEIAPHKQNAALHWINKTL